MVLMWFRLPCYVLSWIVKAIRTSVFRASTNNLVQLSTRAVLKKAHFQIALCRCCLVVSLSVNKSTHTNSIHIYTDNVYEGINLASNFHIRNNVNSIELNSKPRLYFCLSLLFLILNLSFTFGVLYARSLLN